MLTLEEAKKCIKDTSLEMVDEYYYIIRGNDPDYPLRPFYFVMCTGSFVSLNLINLLKSVSDNHECYVVKCKSKGVYEMI